MGWIDRIKSKDTARASAKRGDDYSFRRSRTLSGNKKSGMQTAPSSLSSDRLRKYDFRQLRIRIARLVLFLIFCSAFLILLVANYIKTANVVIAQSTTKQPPIATYQKTIMQYFNDHPLEKFSFLLNQSHLNQYLTTQNTEIASLAVHSAWYGGTEQFLVTFRKPLLVWQLADKKFYVDEKGVAFTYNQFSDPAVIVNDQSGVLPDPSGAIASKRLVRFLGELVADVNRVGKGQVSAVIVPQSTREIDIKLTGRNYIIKTHIDRDPAAQAEDIKRVLEYFDNNHIVPQYIDVRVATKVYYQ
ncbi:MAG TPA: hypothetical protein VNX65_03295 [Patescibacteria group bacterium]|jgi:hypothetical protein|nr:hypothetical protein [Patescibacteria group bacterium]